MQVQEQLRVCNSHLYSNVAAVSERKANTFVQPVNKPSSTDNHLHTDAFIVFD